MPEINWGGGEGRGAHVFPLNIHFKKYPRTALEPVIPERVERTPARQAWLKEGVMDRYTDE